MSVTRRLVLDLQGCQDVRNGDRGIGRAVAELAAALHARPGVVAALVLNPQLPFPGHLPPSLLESPLLGWSTSQVLERARRDGPVAYHLLSPFELATAGPIAVPEHALSADVAVAVLLYDLIPLLDPERLLPGQALPRYRQRLELVRGCDLVLCLSEHTRNDALRLLGGAPDRYAVVGAGADERFHPPGPGDDPDAVLRRAVPALRPDYVLMVSGGDERKNTERMIAAFARLPDALRAGRQLVVACDLDPGIGRAWAAHAAAVGLGAGEVVFTGFVAEETLVALYQRAALVVMPSLYEGYGLPVAEAIACGRPAVTSCTTSLPEILDLPESTFDPLDVGDMARVVGRALGDAAFTRRLVEAGRRAAPRHRWDAVAERVLAAQARLPEPPPHHRPGRRPDRRLRLALVGPLPPVRSGIADYNERVCAELAVRADLDVLVPATHQRPRLSLGRTAPYRELPAEALGRSLNPQSYDAILYTFGNSEHHLVTYDLAMRFPGVLWMHDVRLGGFHHAYAQERTPPAQREAWMAAELRAAYGSRLAPLAGVPTLFDRSWQHRHGIFLSRALTRHARAVIVHSGFAERVLELDQGPDGVLPPVLRIPQAVPTQPPRDAPDLARGDPPTVATFGLVDWIKAPDRLIEAMAATPSGRSARLVLVGPVWGPDREELEGLALRLDLGDRVVFTGPVARDEWWGWLRRATVAVQLRRLTNAETSAAVSDAQSVGTPVVTNMVGARADYPADAVLAIDPRLLHGDLEEALTALLTDRAVWDRHSRAGLAYARARSFSRIVDMLLGHLEGLVARDGGVAC